MSNWKYEVKIKHLLTEEEDYDSVQKAMNKIVDVLDKNIVFTRFKDKNLFRKIPAGNGIMKPIDYAEKLLNKFYDYCDAHLIWVE